MPLHVVNPKLIFNIFKFRINQALGNNLKEYKASDLRDAIPGAVQTALWFFHEIRA
jgi:hypothetical protein